VVAQPKCCPFTQAERQLSRGPVYRASKIPPIIGGDQFDRDRAGVTPDAGGAGGDGVVL